MTIEGVNAHFYRNFETTDGDEDMQMKLEDAGNTVSVVGFVYDATSAAYTTYGTTKVLGAI